MKTSNKAGSGEREGKLLRYFWYTFCSRARVSDFDLENIGRLRTITQPEVGFYFL